MFDKLTIYVEWSGGQWNAQYRATDEQRDYRFASWNRVEAIAKAANHSGYKLNECRVVFVD